jgi:hypothetical protein
MAGKGLSHNKASEHDLGLFSACNCQHGLPRVIESCGDSCKFQPFQAMSATCITYFNAKQLKSLLYYHNKQELFPPQHLRVFLIFIISKRNTIMEAIIEILNII